MIRICLAAAAAAVLTVLLQMILKKVDLLKMKITTNLVCIGVWLDQLKF